MTIDQVVFTKEQGSQGIEGTFLPAERSQSIKFTSPFANQLVVFNRHQQPIKDMFFSLEKRKTRNAASYVRVRYDPRTICSLSDLLRRNHEALSVSFQQNFQQFLRYFYHQPVERAELLRDLAPLALPNQECKLCGITAWLHMVRVDW